ncbi:hypothetical protein [Alkalibacillus filiformis]|uniref:hypothetical protein n=1 Tax=Alkalibacillus filiformis TaxID=200990 RepID=UPI0027D8F718|nr:hypothetical protein [Alkalibacillus filiformis]
MITINLPITNKTDDNSEFKHKEGINLNSLIIGGSTLILGLNIESFEREFFIETRGYPTSSQINHERRSLISNYGLDAKFHGDAHFIGFIEVNEQGEDSIYRISREFDFAPGDHFYSYGDLILTIPSSQDKVGIYNLETNNFIDTLHLEERCHHLNITGKDEIAYIACGKFNPDDRDIIDTTIYKMDLEKMAFEEQIQMDNIIVSDLAYSENHGLLVAMEQYDTYTLARVDDQMYILKRIDRVDEARLKTITVHQNHVYLLKNKLNNNIDYVGLYDIKHDDYQVTNLSEGENALDLLANQDDIYVLVFNRDNMQRYLLMFNKHLQHTNTHDLTNIVPDLMSYRGLIYLPK